jgi:hypothetical protein
MTTHAAPSYYTDAKYYSTLSYLLHIFSYVTTTRCPYASTTLFPGVTPRLPLITPPKRSNTTPKWYYSGPIYTTITEAAKCYAVQTYTTQKLLFRATLNRNTTLMLQFTTPRPTLHRSPQVLHRRSRLLQNKVCSLVYYTEAPKYYITKAPEFYTSMYPPPAYYTEAPH